MKTCIPQMFIAVNVLPLSSNASQVALARPSATASPAPCSLIAIGSLSILLINILSWVSGVEGSETSIAHEELLSDLILDTSKPA